MTVKSLIARLMKMNQDSQVMVHEGNSMRAAFVPATAKITREDAYNSGDCEDRVGEEVVVL
jgi:hypothetical protein